MLAVMACIGSGQTAWGEEPADAPEAATQAIAPTPPAETLPDGSAPRPVREVRALWVTRWDYTQPEHVRAIMANAASLGFNVVFFQVRGNATVFYLSQHEPWAWELTGSDPSATGQDPGWDPLGLAVEEAHAHGLELHAYVNLLPGWRGATPPPFASGQLYWTRPEWFMCNIAGRRMEAPGRERGAPRDWYAFLSPGIPEVREHLAAICVEIATKYSVDGLHFDYIRYPAEIRSAPEEYAERAHRLGNWSYDPVSLARFSQETGLAGPEADPEAWTRWRARQVTETVRLIRQRVEAHRPGIIFSAAVIADPTDAYSKKFQDYLTWAEEGILDMVVTMNYHADIAVVRERAEQLIALRPARGRWVTGLGIGYGAQGVQEQIELIRSMPFDGFSCFAYAFLFNRSSNHEPRELAEILRQSTFLRPALLPEGWREP